MFVSSISAYVTESMGYGFKDRVLREPIIDEDWERFSPPPPPDWNDGDEAPYGLTKALGENIAHAAFPDRTTVVRPGLIVGTRRPDRPIHLLARADRRGRRSLGSGQSEPRQPDHRPARPNRMESSAWPRGEPPATSTAPVPPPACRWQRCSTGSCAVTSAPVKFTWVSEAFLEEQGVRPWGDVPSWIPGCRLDVCECGACRGCRTGLPTARRHRARYAGMG